MTAVEYTTTCAECDWQPDPTARAGLETQCERHMRDTQHSPVITLGTPVEEA